MRQTLSKGMVVAAAATSILSLYSSQAFADSDASGAAADSPGVLSGNNVQAPLDVPVNACGNSADVVAALNPAFGNSCDTSKGKHRKPDASHHGASAGHGAAAGHGSDRGHGSDHGDGAHHGDGSGHHAGAGGHHDGSAAHGVGQGSAGAAAGNTAQAPVDVPVNACGNTVDVIGLLNPAFGNGCAQDDGPKGYGDDEVPPSQPPSTQPPSPEPPSSEPPATPPVTPPHTPPGTVTPGTGPSPHTPATGGAPRQELAHTGAEGMLAASAAGLGLLLGGAVLYRRNRAASRQW